MKPKDPGLINQKPELDPGSQLQFFSAEPPHDRIIPTIVRMDGERALSTVAGATLGTELGMRSKRWKSF